MENKKLTENQAWLRQRKHTSVRHLEQEEIKKQEMKRVLMLVSMTEECRTERETRRVMREREMMSWGGQWGMAAFLTLRPASPGCQRLPLAVWSDCPRSASSAAYKRNTRRPPQSSVHVQQRRRLETELLNMQVPSCSFQCSKVDNVPDISIFSKLHLLADVSLSTTLKSRCLINADETKISYTHKHILTQPSCETFQRKYPTQRQIKGGEVYF